MGHKIILKTSAVVSETRKLRDQFPIEFCLEKPLRAAVRKYRLGVCKMKKIENPQTLSEYRSR